jgi:hypothetical protein
MHPALWRPATAHKPHWPGYTVCLHIQVSYPTQLKPCRGLTLEARREPEKPAGKYRQEFGGKDRGALHPGCGKTFTFLPLLSLPYTHYSLLTRCQGLRRRLVEHCSWEEATPTLKDPNRVPDATTLRRWARGLDHSQPAFSFLHQTLTDIARWLVPGHSADPRAGPLSWLNSVLPIFWPLRL